MRVFLLGKTALSCIDVNMEGSRAYRHMYYCKPSLQVYKVLGQRGHNPVPQSSSSFTFCIYSKEEVFCQEVTPLHLLQNNFTFQIIHKTSFDHLNVQYLCLLLVAHIYRNVILVFNLRWFYSNEN